MRGIFLIQLILFQILLHILLFVVLEGDGYGDEMAIGYEGVEGNVGDFFEDVFAFECIVLHIDFFGICVLIFVGLFCLVYDEVVIVGVLGTN